MRANSWRGGSFPLTAAVILLSALTLIGIRGYANYNAVAPFPDFHAFYCGARVVLEHGDPYKQQPLAACEAPLIARYFPAGTSGVAVPAPVPGYVFALFVPFALLPFAAASWLFFILTVCAIAATIVALRSLTDFSWLTLTVLTLAIDAPAALALGQVTPLAICGLALCALQLRRRKSRLAVLAATPVWLAPQVAIPLAVALFAAHARARVAVILQLALLALVTLILTGPALAIEYVAKVIPAHAASELSYAQQIALGPMLAQLGTAPPIAMSTGSAVWLGACAAAAVFARRITMSDADPALSALLPASFGLIGGTFLHPSAISVAFPLALVLACRETARPYAACALVLLLPWMPSGVTFFLWPFVVLAALMIAVEIGKWRAFAALALAIGAGIVLFEINVDFATHIAQSAPYKPVVAHVAPYDLAERSWTAVIKSNWALALSWGVWLARAAAVCGIVLACVTGAAAAGKRRRSSREA